MIQNYIENANFEDTGFYYTLSLISGKHKMVILYCLMEFKVVRFNELKRYLKNISDKTLVLVKQNCNTSVTFLSDLRRRKPIVCCVRSLIVVPTICISGYFRI